MCTTFSTAERAPHVNGSALDAKGREGGRRLRNEEGMTAERGRPIYSSSSPKRYVHEGKKGRIAG